MGRGGQRKKQVHDPETDISTSSQNGHLLGIPVALSVNGGYEI